MLTIVGGMLAPILMQSLIVPAVDQLQGGLTPFGLINLWPWIGQAALDAGQRRVAVLPSVAIIALALVTAAQVWLSARLAGRATHSVDESPGHIDWAALRDEVWWARGWRRG